LDLIIIQNPVDRTDAIRQALRRSSYIKVLRCRWINNYTAVAVTLGK
jgi:hypothetical protein